MKLIIIRHAIAMDREVAKRKYIKDIDRPLTKEGVKEFSSLLNSMRSKLLGIDILFTSPAKRTLDTTRLVRRLLRVKKTRENDLLLPNSGVLPIANGLRKRKEKTIAIVGHEPQLSKLVTFLLTKKINAKSIVKLKKGSICILEKKSSKFSLLELLVP